MIFGTFDILHKGHISFLEQARKLGDTLIVIVGRDNNVIRIKGKRPIDSEAERIEKIKKLNIADEVMIGENDNFFKQIEEENPDIIAIGYDQKTFGLNEWIINNNKQIKIIVLKPFKENIYKSKLLRKEK